MLITKVKWGVKGRYQPEPGQVWVDKDNQFNAGLKNVSIVYLLLHSNSPGTWQAVWYMILERDGKPDYYTGARMKIFSDEDIAKLYYIGHLEMVRSGNVLCNIETP